MTCPSLDQIQAYLADSLDARRCDDIELHVEQCASCQQRLAALTDTTEMPFDLDRSTPIESVRPSQTGKTAITETPSLPGFEVIRLLGRGGIGVVYEAIQVELNRRVAVKMLQAEACDAEMLTRFQREAEIVAGLDHPNIVRIFGVGAVDGRPYLSLEYVNGGNLAERLRQSPLTSDDAAALLEQVARGIHCAHRAGVIHRDLKPANILLQVGAGVSADDWKHLLPKVADFGLARQADASQTLTQAGALMGTPNYMAPEQTKEKSTHVGPPTDVHALGAILYEMLTGRPPFLGANTVQTMLTLINTEAVPPRRLNPSVPRDLETICLKCLEKDPARRYASAGELADDVRRFLDGKPIVARPVGTLERSAKWARRRPALAALIMLLIVVSTVGLPLMTYLWQDAVDSGTQAKKALSDKETQRQIAVTAGEKTKAALLDEEKQRAIAVRAVGETKKALADEEKQRTLAEANLSALMVVMAHREWLADHVGQAEKLLNKVPKAHRQWEWHYVKRLCHKGLLTLKGHTGYVKSVAYHPNGKHLASGGFHSVRNLNLGQVRIWDADSGKTLFTLDGHKAPVLAVAYSPDGQHLASSDEQGMVRLWNPATGAEVHTFKAHREYAFALAFHPDSTRLVSAGSDNQVRVWDVASATELFKFPESKQFVFRVNSVAYSPAGDRIATGGASKYVKIWDAFNGTELFRLGPHQQEIECIAFRPDGQQLVSASTDRTIRVWDLKTKSLLQVLHGHTRSVGAVLYTPDGKTVISGGLDAGLGELKVWNPATGLEKFSLRGHHEGIRALAIRHDGLRLASGSVDKTVRIWDPTNDLEADTLRNVAQGVAFSPDSKHLAAVEIEAKAPMRIKIWDVKTLQPIDALLPDLRGLRNATYSADGLKIAACYQGDIIVWDLPARRFKQTANTQFSDLAFSPDGAFIAVATGNNRVARLLNAATGEQHRTLAGHGGAMHSVRYARDGKRIVTTGENDARLWNASDGALMHTLKGHTFFVDEAVFSFDSTRVATASRDRTARIWDVDTGKLLVTLPEHGHFVNSAAFSPDGRLLATADNEGAVRLSNAHTGEPLLTLHRKSAEGLPGATVRPHRVAFTPDGYRLAAWYSDQTIRIWNGTPLE